jgi:HlyD family secretion protein
LLAVQRQITAAQLSARIGEIAPGEAAVRVANTCFEQAQTHLTQRRVPSPANARVQDAHYRVREVVNVNAGDPALVLLPAANLKIRFSVPEPVLATLSFEQSVDVTCDSYSEDLQIRVAFVSRQTELTQPVIFSEQERSKLAFRAEARPQFKVELPIGLSVTTRLANASSVASVRP